MARLVVGVAFGLLVGTGLGAALGIHADEADGATTAPSSDVAADNAGVEAPFDRPLATPTPVAEDDPQADDTPEPVPVRVQAAPISSVWARLAACESGGNWHTNTGNGYYGGLQEDMAFWRNYGGLAYAARPDLASPDAQIAVAVRGQAVQGWGAWPVCSRVVGLRR